MITGEIKIVREKWAPPGVNKFLYVSPEDGRYWNVDSIKGSFLQLWNVDPWGTLHTKVVGIKEFMETWNERKLSLEILPESTINASAPDASEPSEMKSTSSHSKGANSWRDLRNILSSILP